MSRKEIIDATTDRDRAWLATPSVTAAAREAIRDVADLDAASAALEEWATLRLTRTARGEADDAALQGDLISFALDDVNWASLAKLLLPHIPGSDGAE